MHVCFLCHEYPPAPHGGVGSFVRTMARALAARGHRVSVVGLNKIAERVEEDDQGVRVIRLPRSPLPGAGFVVHRARLRRALLGLHRETPIDVLEGTEAGLALLPKTFPAPRLIRMHGGHHFFSITLGGKASPWRGWLEVRSFARAEHLCAVSNYVAETTRGLLGLGRRPVEILPNPVDLELFRPAAAGSEEDGLLLFVGAVCEKKGVRQLVQAMPAIVAAAPHARLRIVGRDTRDARTGRSFTAGLRELVPSDLEARVEFTGPVEHARLPELLAQAQVCVYPSHMEAMPLAWLEGMAAGKAVVASRTGPGPEVIEHGVSGLLCDPHDPASIAREVIRLLTDGELRRRLGRQARQRVAERFSVNTLIGRNEAFYQECARAGREAQSRRRRVGLLPA
ncbi:MAG: glycosyltransferase family 4 protein [Pyrinomonadaceae bacterium]